MREIISRFIHGVESATGADALLIANIFVIIVFVIIARNYSEQEKWEKQVVWTVGIVTIVYSMVNVYRVLSWIL